MIDSVIDLEDLRHALNDLQDYAMRTRFLYVDAVDSIDKEVRAPTLRYLLRMSYAALGLGESGEVQNKVKKLIRDTGGVATQDDKDAIGGEIWDSILYHCSVATELNVNLGDIAVDGLRRLESGQARGILGGSGDRR